MDVFHTAASIASAIVGGIIVLGIFFAIMERLGRMGSPHTVVVPHSAFLIEGSRVNLLLRRGERLNDLRFVGFTTSAGDDKMPYELNKLAAFDTDRGTRVYVRAERIVLIEQLHPPPINIG